MKILIIILMGTSMFVSCSKSTIDKSTPFVGKWTQSEVYGNDYWGGPFYWRNVNTGIQVQFTSDGKYYRTPVDSASLTLIGSYKVLSNDQIEITPVNSSSSSYPTYTLNFSFEHDGQMILGNFATEGIIKEKLTLEK